MNLDLPCKNTKEDIQHSLAIHYSQCIVVLCFRPESFTVHNYFHKRLAPSALILSSVTTYQLKKSDFPEVPGCTVLLPERFTGNNNRLAPSAIFQFCFAINKPERPSPEQQIGTIYFYTLYAAANCQAIQMLTMLYARVWSSLTVRVQVAQYGLSPHSQRRSNSRGSRRLR